VTTIANRLVETAKQLCVAVERLRFEPPVEFVYNPLDYAWPAHEAYLKKFGGKPKRVVFLGMNPGPFGMAQTGVPFGEVNAVRCWMRIAAAIGRPPREHPKRPIEGFDCRRSEVSGRRLWGLFAERFERAEQFFAHHFVLNYCPLAFLNKDGRNLTPDKAFSPQQATPLFLACDRHLNRVVEILEPEWLIGIGDFAERRARLVLLGTALKIGRILHPSPANPSANRDWAGSAARQLEAAGVW
jgi:single-strand selective monofunctional uracil DNA glycosylase